MTYIHEQIEERIPGIEWCGREIYSGGRELSTEFFRPINKKRGELPQIATLYPSIRYGLTSECFEVRSEKFNIIDTNNNFLDGNSDQLLPYQTPVPIVIESGDKQTQVKCYLNKYSELFIDGFCEDIKKDEDHRREYNRLLKELWIVVDMGVVEPEEVINIYSEAVQEFTNLLGKEGLKVRLIND